MTRLGAGRCMKEIRQQLYRLLVENSLGLMCIHDLDGLLLEINPAASESLQYPMEEGIGHNLREFLMPGVQRLFEAYLERIRSNPTDSGLMRLRAKDGGERIWFYRNIRYEEPGVAPLVLGQALDVTERVRAEHALKGAEKELRRAHDELALRVEERTAELQRSNQRLRAEMEHRRQVEEELLQAKKLEAIGVLAGGIAHDLNNFLTVVQGSADLAATHTQPGQPIYEILGHITAACERAALLSTQLLTFSKGGSPVRQTGSIAYLLRECADLAQAGSAVRVDAHVAPDLWPAEFDAGQMSQVFHNILMNAREAMPGGGVVELRATNVNVDCAYAQLPAGRYLMITVRDQGCGISLHMLPKIFDPYFSTKKTGTGLGLATAYSIVAKHQGHISVQSAEGEGTTFTIHLPAAQSAPAPEADQPRVIHAGSGRILLMDDETAILRMLSRTLQHLGYEVDCAASGAEAITLFDKAAREGRGFVAALLDLTVPGGMGGRETATLLRQIDPSVRIIVSSGYSDSAIMSDFRGHGFDAVLPKPWTLAQLSEVLKRVLDSR